MEFRGQIKDMEGQKYVFLFFQKKTVPIPPEFGELDDLNDLVRPVISFNVDKVKEAFSDSLISIHFIFVTKTDQYQLDGYRMNPTRGGRGLQLVDQSAEIFGAFHEMADATGGTIDSSANIASSFQRAAVASENYYLLYYTPKDYKSDGKFKKIEVKITGKNYRITHRAGYIAD
jgi:VWFA-related protein